MGMASSDTDERRYEYMLEVCVVALTPTRGVLSTHAPVTDSCPPILPLPAVFSVFLSGVSRAAYP